MPEIKEDAVCFECGKPLDLSDKSKVHLAIDADEAERLGVYAPSEIREQHAVIIMLCPVCGTRAMAPTAQELQDRYPENEVIQ